MKMCGYCSESAYLLSFIDENIDVTNPFVYPVYIEENENFIEELNTTKEIYNIISISDISEICIVCCKIFEKLILQNKNFCHILKDKHYMDGIKEIDTLNTNRCEYTYLNNFTIEKLCIDAKYREEFLQDKTKLINISTKILKSYCKFWILGHGKEISCPDDRMSEKGIMDPVENTTPEDWERFYSSFPIVFLAFLLLERYIQKSKIIKYIALNHPHDVPDFPGLDLWLQRRAFIKCIKEYGIQFFLKNYESIRLELLYYSILKNVITRNDLLLLKKYLLTYDKKYWGYSIDAEMVIEVINKKLKAEHFS